MMNIIIIICVGLICLVIGILLANTMLKKALEKKSQQMLKDAETEGEVLKKEKMLQAKEKFLQLKAEHEKSINEKNNLGIRIWFSTGFVFDRVCG